MHSDDRTLIEAFQDGDDFAFVSLYNRHKAAVYTYCVKMVLDRDAAQDVMQETFIRVFENRDRLLNAGSFRAWLFTIARNQCLNALRRDRRLVSLDGTGGDVIYNGDLPTANLEKHEQVALINTLLGRLKADYREVVVLREYQNLSYEEIAAITRSTLSAVKSRLFKARRRLAEMMEEMSKREAKRGEERCTGGRLVDE